VTLRRWLAVYLVVVHLLAAAVATYFLRDQPPWLLASEVLLVVSLACGLLLAQRVFAALSLVREAQQLLDDGDFMSRVREVGQPEVDRILRLFNRLSDRLRDERVRLQEQQHFLSRILAVSPLGILFLDFDGRIAYVNPASERLLQQESSQLLGRRLAQVAGPVAEALVALPVDASCMVGLWGGRRVRCQHGSFPDRGFPRSYMQIEELTEELRQFEKAAYGKLIRMMSHEVNNSVGASNSLLNSCLNYAAELPEEHRRDFESALSIAIGRTNQLDAFMRGFADVIRLPAPVRRPCDPREMIGRIAALMKAQCDERQVAWRWVEEEPLPRVSMDQVQMEQVFLNVAKNAVEAIGHGGCITVRTCRKDGRPAVIIEDTGPGLSAEARQNLFTPFFSTKEGGQGIGLTLVQEILAQHRFQYSLDSAPGGPTQFTIVF
jgi:two-component system, NtrC family, nitrogen regulation sensor histidine kinase NtrY